MSKVNIKLDLLLEDNEFIKVGGHIYATKASILNEETKIHIVNRCCLQILKEFDGLLTPPIIDEWLLLSRALDQSCCYETKWDDRKILQELINGEQKPVSWYASNCKVN